jgi:transposase
VTLFEITDEFLQEELDRTRQFSKKGGPYTKSDREKRRNEVYRLHFEHGISAVKIAEMMKIHRHTISKDIEFWNNRLQGEWEKIDVVSWTMKIIHRFDLQRTSLYKELEATTNLNDKLAVRKLIFDIDYRMSQTIPKLATTKEVYFKTIRDAVNKIMEEHKIPKRVIGMYELQGVSEEVDNKIRKMIDDDQESMEYWEFDNIEEDEM